MMKAHPCYVSVGNAESTILATMTPRRRLLPPKEAHPLKDPRGYSRQTKAYVELCQDLILFVCLHFWRGLSFNGRVYITKVGETNETWTGHERLLCRNSAFFRSAAKGEWMNNDKTASMPEDDDVALARVLRAIALYRSGSCTSGVQGGRKSTRRRRKHRLSRRKRTRDFDQKLPEWYHGQPRRLETLSQHGKCDDVFNSIRE